MEHMLKKSFAIAALCSFAIVNAATNTVAPYYSIRSQGFDAARDLVGWANDFHIKLFDIEDEFYGSFSITPEYTKSFRDERIASCLFGDDLVKCDCPTLKIQGSGVANRDDKAWLADYFGLPTDFSSQFTFKPEVSNFILDFQMFMGLDKWMSGLYFRAHTPFVHTRWKLQASESITAAGTAVHPTGYFDARAEGNVEATTARNSMNPRSNLLANASEFFVNGKAPTLGFVDNVDSTNRVVFNGLTCSRWNDCGCDSLTENKLAEVTAALGWNFLLEEDYHLGLEVRAAAPTGTRPEACNLFAPVVGNGHHWELGGGVSGHYVFWRSEDGDSQLGFYVDANIMHLFDTRQKRAFDLKTQKGNSRYMLAAKMKTSGVANLLGTTSATGASNTGTTPATAQFDNVFTPVANLTCCNVDVSSSVQGDVVAMFNYTYGAFTFDLGYNFWARACEDIELNCDCPCPLQEQKNTWVLKGDAHVFGYAAGDTTDPIANHQSVALSASNNAATVRSGTNKTVTDTGFARKQNPSVNNAQFAVHNTAAANNRLIFAPNQSTNDISTQTRTSIQPVFLSVDDIDFGGAQTKGQSHKIFGHLQYTWKDREKWVPYIGVGAKVEFASGNSCDSDCDTDCNTSSSSSSSTSCDTSCDSCHKCSLSEWGVWLKGGISFN